MSEYKPRSAINLDISGNYYIKHVGAMTKEGLHSKADIAEELAVRDAQIDYLIGRIGAFGVSYESIVEDLPQFLLGDD